MTYCHLQADCLYTGISSGLNARYRVWESLYTFTFYVHKVLARVRQLCGQTLRTRDNSNPRHFGTSAELSARHRPNRHWLRSVRIHPSSTLPFELPVVPDQPQIRASETKPNHKVTLTLIVTLILTVTLLTVLTPRCNVIGRSVAAGCCWSGANCLKPNSITLAGSEPAPN